MDTSDVYTQVFQSLMPLIQIAIVLWAAETILTMLIKEHRKSKKKKEREKRRLEYQDRRMPTTRNTRRSRARCAMTCCVGMASGASSADVAARMA